MGYPIRATYCVVVGLLAGCGGKLGESLDTTEQGATCPNPDGYYGMEAALGVAMGIELGQWNSTEHLINSGWRNVTLTSAAKQLCQSRDFAECANTQSILDMQQIDSLATPDGQRIWDGEQFYRQLQVGLQRQAIVDSRAGTDGCPPLPHTLVFNHSTTGICGQDYWFDVAMSGSPEQLKCKLTYVGYPENTWLAFQSTGSTLALDPSPNMIDPDESTPCINSIVAYDPDLSMVGHCCRSGEFFGSFVAAGWNASTLVCRF
jgi:hypothetical protein